MKPWIILTFGWLMAPGGFLHADELDPHMVAEGAKGIEFEKQLFSHLTSGNNPSLRDGLGRVYRFDQKFLEGNLRGYLDGYRKEVAKEKERDERTVLFYKTSLAYGIMAAGQYAEPSKEIVDVLTELAELFINQPTPPNVSSPSSQMVAIASMAFRDEQEDILDVNVLQVGEAGFNELITDARFKMAARAASKKRDERSKD
jgi:hypothetical protein